MLWHEEPKSMNPSEIQLILKPGHITPEGSHCGPRLFWTDSDKNSPYGFSVFDIRSLVGAHPTHLQDYPFAIPGRTVFLRLTRGRDFVFEAKSEEDAKRFVHGLRWSIARLSFNLVIGNLDVSCELLDVGLKGAPTSLIEQAEWTRAMDDVTDQLVQKSVFHV